MVKFIYIPAFLLLTVFCFSQQKYVSPTPERIESKKIKEATTINNILSKTPEGCSVVSYECITKINEKVNIFKGSGPELRQGVKDSLSHTDKDARIYIDVLFRCPEEKKEMYCFKVQE